MRSPAEVAAAKVVPEEGTLGMLSELRRAVKSEHPGAVVSDANATSSISPFVQFLHTTGGAQLVFDMKSFVKQAENAPSLAGDALITAVHNFYLGADELLLRQSGAWAGEGATCWGPAELDGARDGLEQFVMGRLVSRALPLDAAMRPDERELRARRRALAPILTPERLGMSPRFARGAPWPEAQAELCAMARFSTPRNKLACLLNCCERLNQSLAASAREHAAEAAAAAPATALDSCSESGAGRRGSIGGAHGADELLPALVTVMLHCRLRPLAASLAYAAAYRHPIRMESEGECRYYLTLALSSLEFIRTCGAAELVGVSPRAFSAALAFGLAGRGRRRSGESGGGSDSDD